MLAWYDVLSNAMFSSELSSYPRTLSFPVGRVGRAALPFAPEHCRPSGLGLERRARRPTDAEFEASECIADDVRRE